MTATAVQVRNTDGFSPQQGAADPRLPATVDKSALKSYLAQLEDPDALKLQNRLAGAYDAACNALLGPNDIQLEGGRSFKKRSAWRKLARYFGISTTVASREERYLNNEATGETVFVASCTVRAVSPWGQSNDAVGACGTDEETGRRKISIADAIATAETRAGNRAISNLVAMGEVSHEEMTRGERDRGMGEAVAADMTLEEARAVGFPWGNVKKYPRDTPFGKLSARMLTAVLKQTNDDIAKSGPTPKRLEMQRAATLCLAAMPAAPEGASGAPPGIAGEGTPPGGLRVPAPPPVTVAGLQASVAKLLEHPALSDAARVSFRAWQTGATTEVALLELIHAVEASIASRLETVGAGDHDDDVTDADIEHADAENFPD